MYLNKICHIYKYYICLLYEEISHSDRSIYYELQLCTLILYSVCMCTRTHTHTENVNTLSLNTKQLFISWTLICSS